MYTISAFLLRGVAGYVCGLQGRLCVEPPVVKRYQSNTGPDSESLIVEQETKLLHAAADQVCYTVCLIISAVSENDTELVTSQTCQSVACAHDSVEEFSYLHQQLVPAECPQASLMSLN